MGALFKYSTRNARVHRVVFCLCTALLLFACKNCVAQGWVARVAIVIDHDLYPYERMDLFTLTFSGVTMTGKSETGGLSFTMSGTTPISGEIKLSVNGFAWAPYDPGTPPAEYFHAKLTGNHNTPCTLAVFEGSGDTPEVRVSLHMTIHPRMEISQVQQQCGQLSLTSSTCFGSLIWEVSESISDGFKTITGKSSPSISITREELIALGFASPYGRKYFRVTGLTNTTSQLQPIDIYYPGPSASLEITPPTCHGASDGATAINVASALPSTINDFVLTLFDASGDPLRQSYIVDGDRIVVDGLPAGGYRVRIENNTAIGTYGNCWAEDTFALIDPEPVTISSARITDYNGFQISCNGGSDGSVRINPAGGTGAYASYEWTPAVSASQGAAELSEGTYQVRVQDSNQCWSEVFSYSLKAPDKLTTGLLSAGGRNGFDVSCHDKADGILQTDVTGGVQPYRYLWADGHTASIRTNLRPGSYSVTVSDANACEARESTTLVSPEPIAFSIEEIQGITCAGSFTGVLEIQSISNAIGEITASWSSGESGLQISDKSAGLYRATVGDEQGCSATVSYELEDPPAYTVELLPASSYNGSAISCHGVEDGELTAILRDDQGNAVAGDHYVWYRNGAELISLAGKDSIAGLNAGFYKVEVTYRTFCKAEQGLTLDEPDPVIVMIATASSYNGMPITCAGKTDGHIRALADGGTGSEYNFEWSNGATGPDLQNVGAGTFRVTARDVNGCSATGEKTIAGPDSLEVEISVLSDYNGQAISCTGRSDARIAAIARGGTAPYRFAWHSGETAPVLTDVPSGNYVVTAVDANGCAHIADTVLADPLPVIARIAASSDYSGFGVSCNGTSDGHLLADGSGGTGDYSYRWSASDNTRPLLANLTSGNYQVIVADENSCADTLVATLTEPAPLRLEVSATRNVSCSDGDDGQITLRAYGGAGGYAYSLGDTWQESAVFDALPARPYTPTVRDVNNCTRDTTQVILEPSRIEIRFNAIEPALCGDPVGKISAQVSGGTGAYTLEWNDADNHSVGLGNTVSGLSAGVFTLVVHDENRCEVTASAGVPSSDGPTADVTNVSPTSCSYTADGAALLEPRGNGPFSFQWPNGNTAPAAGNLEKGLHLVEVTDADGCLTVIPVTVSGPDPLAVDVLERTMPACNGDCNGAIRLAVKGGTGDYQYNWAHGSGPMMGGLCAGSYAITVSDENQCEIATTIQLDEPSPITSSLTALKDPTCPGSCDARIELRASGGTGTLRYAWSNGDTLETIDAICAGEYRVLITDANQCVESAQFPVQDPEGPSLNLEGPIMICAGQTHLLDPGSAWTSYRWGSDHGTSSTDRRLTVSKAGRYWIEVVDAAGCIARDTFRMETSDDLLKANFLLATEAFALDTIVAIDVSWPMPSAITWSFPAEMHLLRDLGDIVYGQFEDAGDYHVTLSAMLGECRDQLTKLISIIEKNGRVIESGKPGDASFVREFTVYPNPTDGQFNVRLSFLEETPVVLTLFDQFTSRKIVQFEKSGSRDYAMNIDLMSASAGAYSLRVDYRKGALYKRIIVR